MRRGVLLFLFLLTFLLGLALGFFLGKNWPLFEKETIPDKLKEPRVELDYGVGVWLVWWDQDNGFETLQESVSFITSVKPFWYQVAADGTIEKYSGAEDEEIIAFAEESDVKIVPVISNNHQPELVEPILSDPALKAAHIQNIVDLIKTNDYDGIEIDYESLRDEDRDNFSAFMQSLAVAVHNEGRILTAAVHAKTSEPGTWDGPQAQDWEVLGSVCDEIKVMVYDYHWSASEAGAIAPLDWTEEVIAFAISKVPKEKVYLGVPFYGYDWVGEQGGDVTWDDAQELIDRYDSSLERDSASNEVYFTYQKDSELHEVWFNDSASLAARLDLVREYGVAGIGIWRIGQEDPATWQVIEEKFKTP
jgi:spore germination protein